MPAISVVMSVYNGEKYLQDSVESILNQTFADFEFLIADDCSTDNTCEMLQEFARKDSRIVLMSNSENVGLTKSLNRMIDISHGDFIARMDADDVSYAQRFQKQIDYMRAHPDIGVCGTNIDVMHGKIRKLNCGHFFEHDEIKAALLFNNAMPHTSVMIRSELFKEHGYRYNEKFKIMQDYELWQRLIKGTRFHVLKENLAMFRIVDTGITGESSKKTNYREDILKSIFSSVLADLEIIPTEAEINIHAFIADNNINHNQESLLSSEEWLLKLSAENKVTGFYDDHALRKILHNCWFNICARSTSLGLRVLYHYLKSGLVDYENVKMNSLFKLFTKTLIRHDPGLDHHNNSITHTVQ